MVPVYPASTAEQLSYVVAHSDAKVLFVDTPALLARVFEAWSALAGVSTIVLLDATLDAAAVHASLRAKGASVPVWQSIASKVVTVAEGLRNPWSMAWLPNGDMLVTERGAGDYPGTLRIIRGVKLLPIPSLWGHMAGRPGANPVDTAFINNALKELLAS